MKFKVLLFVCLLLLPGAGLWARADDMAFRGADALYKGELIEAERLFQAAARQAPGSDFIWTQLAVVSMRRERFKEAEERFNKALDLEPDNVFARLWLGLLALSRGDAKAAQVSFDAVLELDPNNPNALYFKGVEAASRHDLQHAVQSFRKAAASGGQDPCVYFRLGQAYAGLDMNANAEIAFLRALELAPGHVGARMGLGALYFARGDAKAAKAAWRTVLSIAPQSGEARSNLAMALVDEAVALERSRKPARAIRCFKQALSYEPTNKAALFHLRRLEGASTNQ